MPLQPVASSFALDAGHADRSRELRRHGLRRHRSRPRLPDVGHVHHALLADGTAVVVPLSKQTPEAVAVHGVTAAHRGRRPSTVEHGLQTDGAVVAELVLEALVLVEVVGGNAHFAHVTVTKVLPSADAADAAVGAVERSRREGHPKIADVAVVLSEGDGARNAPV